MCKFTSGRKSISWSLITFCVFKIEETKCHVYYTVLPIENIIIRSPRKDEYFFTGILTSLSIQKYTLTLKRAYTLRTLKIYFISPLLQQKHTICIYLFEENTISSIPPLVMRPTSKNCKLFLLGLNTSLCIIFFLIK